MEYRQAESLRSSDAEFLISNLSMPPHVLFMGGVATHEAYLEATGADGIELTPMDLKASALMRQIMHETNLPGDKPSYRREAIQHTVRSLHSSFRKEEQTEGVFAQCFPRWTDSLKQLAKIQRITGDLPAVLYPGFKDNTGEPIVYDNRNAPFASRSFQPKVGEWYDMGLNEYSRVEHIAKRMNARGLNAITADVVHIRIEEQSASTDTIKTFTTLRNRGFDLSPAAFKDPLELVDRLAQAGLVHAVHLSLNRLDLTGRYGELAECTRAARKAFIRSSADAAKTLEGEMLVAAAKGHRESKVPTRLRVVLEDGPFRSPLGSKREHAAIIEHARELVAAA